MSVGSFLCEKRLNEFEVVLRKPSDCHHEQRENHLCHFGECPACKQRCQLPLKTCPHSCPSVCHDAVLIKEEVNTSNTPWGLKEKEKVTQKSLPCPPCQVPTTVSCFGEHTSRTFPCSSAQRFCCGQLCSQVLKCQNHLCNRPCHLVTDVSKDFCLCLIRSSYSSNLDRK